MNSKVVVLSPRAVRPQAEPLGLYFRVGRNDHRELLGLLGTGESRFFGVVCDPTCADFQTELVDRALDRRMDVILDPRTQASATVGGFTPSLGALPWGRERTHVEDDFRGVRGVRLLQELARFAIERRYTQILSPSHLIRSVSDAWWDIDRASTVGLRNELDKLGAADIQILYALTISYSLLRDPEQCRALVRDLKTLPIAAIWLSIDGVGSDSTATATRTCIESIAAFHAGGVPIVADHIGGIVGLSLLAFGAAGAMAHGITSGERFHTAHWRRERGSTAFGLARRVYVPNLDLMLKARDAQTLFDFGGRAKATFACTDTRCCPRGVTDMLQRPALHFMHQRIAEISQLGNPPQSLRVSTFLDRKLRPLTDHALSAANLKWDDAALGKRMMEQRKRLDALRVTLGDLAESSQVRSTSPLPLRRVSRKPAQPPASH
jgi:hypothetical protein